MEREHGSPRDRHNPLGGAHHLDTPMWRLVHWYEMNFRVSKTPRRRLSSTVLRAATAILIILAVAAAPLLSQPGPQLLLPGLFHGGEVVVENGSI